MLPLPLVSSARPNLTLSLCDTSAREPHQLTSESKLCVAFSWQTLTNLSKSICNEPTNATTATRRWLGCVLKWNFSVDVWMKQAQRTHTRTHTYKYLDVYVCVWVQMYAQRTDSATTALLTSAAAEPPRSVNSCFVEKQAEHHNEVAVVKLYGALSCLKNNSNRVRAKTQKRGLLYM